MMIILSIVSFVLAAVANAVMDTLAHHYNQSIFASWKASFWNPKYSWANKYKNLDPEQGPKFWGSTTVFVFLTDGWHLAKWIMLLMLPVSPSLLFFQLSARPWWHALIMYVALYAVFSISFHVFYMKIFLKNERSV